MPNREYILIAEDDEDDEYLLRSAFAETNVHAELVFVKNGIELIDHFEALEFECYPQLPLLLIVDLNMPKRNGKEAIVMLAEKEFFKSFPTVVFSTTGNELERKRCRDIGAMDFFVKPSNYNYLLGIVSKFNEYSESTLRRRARVSS